MHIMQEERLTLGEEIRARRKRAGLSQEQLSERLGISREAVSQIERGETRRPSDDILDRLETVLGLSRMQAYLLMGNVNTTDHHDPGVALVQIAALGTHEERLRAFVQLPEYLQRAVMVLMHDLFQDTARRLQASIEPNHPDQ